MAALTITVANILPVSISGITPVRKRATAGATLTAGQAIYLDATDLDSSGIGKAKLADANASEAAAAAVGVTLHGALSGQPVEYMEAGGLAFGAILTKGEIYVLGATAAGDIAPADDLASGWYTTILGYAATTANMVLGLRVTGVTTT